MTDKAAKKRILHITMRWGEGRGGVKQFILNAINALDSEQYDQSLLSVGPITGDNLGLVLHGPIVRRGDPIALVMAVPRLECAIGELAPDVVHIHCNNGLGLLYAEAARRAGCIVRVVHSHNTAVEDGCAVKRIMSSILKRRFSSAPTQCVACSELAGAYLFGDKSFELIRNGIDVERFAFDSCARRDVRSQFGIDGDALVLGHIGSGIPVKNTGFIIDLVRELSDHSVDVHALLVGSGEEIEALKTHSIDVGVSDRVHFTGVVADSWRYYSAMDMFLLPSHYEGLPISLIEAQANGLQCIASDVVSKEANVAELVSYLPLGDAEPWATAVLGDSVCKTDRSCISDKASKAICSAGYSLESLGSQLSCLYRGFES